MRLFNSDSEEDYFGGSSVQEEDVISGFFWSAPEVSCFLSSCVTDTVMEKACRVCKKIIFLFKYLIDIYSL